MKNKKTKTVSYNKVEIESIVCDLCGADEPGIGDGFCSIIQEGGSSMVSPIDICSNCFYEKLTPWLKSQGLKRL